MPARRTEFSARPILDAIRLAISERDIGKNTLAREAGVDGLAIRKVISGSGDIALSSAEKLFETLYLSVEVPSDAVPSDSATEDRHRPLREGLVSAIDASDLTANALGVSAGVAPMHVRRFIEGRGDIMLSTADRLAHALGLKVVPLDQPRVPEVIPSVLSDAIRSAIDASGMGVDNLAGRAGVYDGSLLKFDRHDGDIRLATAGRLFPVLAITIARESGTKTEQPETDLRDAIISAIGDSGESLYLLARRSRCIPYDLRRFIEGRGDIMLSTADRLAHALGLKVVPLDQPILPRPKPSRNGPLKPIADSLRSVIELRRIGVHELSRLSGVSSAVISRLVNRKRNPDYFTSVKIATALGIELIRTDGDASELPPIRFNSQCGFPIIGGGPVRIELTEGERSILATLADGWKESKRFTYAELDALCELDASRRVIERMYRKPCYGRIVACLDKSDGRPVTIGLVYPKDADQ